MPSARRRRRWKRRLRAAFLMVKCKNSGPVERLSLDGSIYGPPDLTRYTSHGSPTIVSPGIISLMRGHRIHLLQREGAYR